jgi:hypothetical protein
LWHGFLPVRGGASDPGGCNSESWDIADRGKSGVPDPAWCKLSIGIIVEVVAAVFADAKGAEMDVGRNQPPQVSLRMPHEQ